jgi:hypothetical protein
MTTSLQACHVGYPVHMAHNVRHLTKEHTQKGGIIFLCDAALADEHNIWWEVNKRRVVVKAQNTYSNFMISVHVSKHKSINYHISSFRIFPHYRSGKSH